MMYFVYICYYRSDEVTLESEHEISFETGETDFEYYEVAIASYLV